MINRPNDLIAIVGNVVQPYAVGIAAPRLLRQRIEIDRASGIITEVEDVPLEPASRAGQTEGGAKEAEGADESSSGDLILDDNHLVFPGFVDSHVQIRAGSAGGGGSGCGESYESAGKSAVRGGITAFAEAAATSWPVRDGKEYRAERLLAKQSPVEVLLFATLGAGTTPLPFPVPYKMTLNTGWGASLRDVERRLREVLSAYRGQFVAFELDLGRKGFSPEDRQSRGSLFAGQGSDIRGRTLSTSEAELVDLALRVAESNQIEPHYCHISSAEGLEAVQKARRSGLQVSCDVTPHHLYYDQDNLSTFARPFYLRSQPPIRTRLDRIALLDGLRSGDIDYLASDHVSRGIEEKEMGLPGVSHLDTFGCFAFWLMREGFTPQDILRVCCENPGRFISRFLPRRYGRIAPGFCGSLTVLKRERVTIRRSDLRSRAGWSAFEGQAFPGRVSHAIVRGTLHRFET